MNQLPTKILTVSIAVCVSIACSSTLCIAVQGKSGKSKGFSKTTGGGNIYSIPKKKTGVGFPSPYSYSKPSSQSHGYNRGQSSRSNSNFNNRSHTHPSYRPRSTQSQKGRNNFSRGGSQLNFSPYGTSFNFGNRGGISQYYIPTNSIDRFGLGVTRYQTGFGSFSNHGFNNFGSYYGAGIPQAQVIIPTQPLGLSAAEQAAQAQLYNQSQTLRSQTIINDSINNRIIANEAIQNQSIPNEFYPQIATTATGRSIQRRAEAAFKIGDYRTAESLASQALVIERDNGKVFLFASQAAFATANFSMAVEYLDKATAMLPSDQWTSVVQNYKTFYGRNDYVGQTNRLTQHLASSPTDADAFVLRGYHYGSLGYVDAATLDFQRALGLNPKHKLANRLMPILGSNPVAVSEEVEAPIPGAVFPSSSRVPSNDGMIYLVPQSDAAQEIGTPALTAPQIEPTIDTGSSILVDDIVK
ncbi:MAG: tetratricopeptide repeat protein [Mariniblastus sp.]